MLRKMRAAARDPELSDQQFEAATSESRLSLPTGKIVLRRQRALSTPGVLSKLPPPRGHVEKDGLAFWL
jgi:hypothetical protein